MTYFPNQKSFFELNDQPESEQKLALETEEKFIKKQLSKEHKKISSIKEGLNIAFEKCMKQEKENSAKIDNLVKELDKKSRQLDVFLTIQSLEKQILQIRADEQSAFLRQQEGKEKELQREYYRLTHKS